METVAIRTEILISVLEVTDGYEARIHGGWWHGWGKTKRQAAERAVERMKKELDLNVKIDWSEFDGRNKE